MKAAAPAYPSWNLVSTPAGSVFLRQFIWADFHNIILLSTKSSRWQGQDDEERWTQRGMELSGPEGNSWQSCASDMNWHFSDDDDDDDDEDEDEDDDDCAE